jgi:sodium/potassium-transporting ATPase subunit alpha
MKVPFLLKCMFRCIVIEVILKFCGLRSSGRFVMTVSCIALLFAVVFFAVGITTVYKGQAAHTVTFAVSILVAFVPEGLPSVVTLLLSIAAKRMAKRNVLVKDLQGVETLGLPFRDDFLCG